MSQRNVDDDRAFARLDALIRKLRRQLKKQDAVIEAARELVAAWKNKDPRSMIETPLAQSLYDAVEALERAEK
jgi:hypothetical protein